VVLDREQLRDITLDDEALMREVVAALIDDTTRQMVLLQAAIEEQDGSKCARLAHYSKGACANLGAQAAAALLKQIENQAGNRRFSECQTALAQLTTEVDRLRNEAVSL
jgi:HPt (histidine-containing phosphotransfer) domain-containing protein